VDGLVGAGVVAVVLGKSGRDDETPGDAPCPCPLVTLEQPAIATDTATLTTTPAATAAARTSRPPPASDASHRAVRRQDDGMERRCCHDGRANIVRERIDGATGE
jgi:hypothetical protein